jgi:hypothetical protein
MDSEFWTSRLAAAKRHYSLQHNHPTSHLGLLSCGSNFYYFFIEKIYLGLIKI